MTYVESSLVTIRRTFSPLLVAVVLLLSLKLAVAQPVEDIKPRIEATLATPLFKNAIVGVLVKSLDDGRVLYEKNADYALMPASNMKLLTATTVAARLSNTFQFTTTLYRTGEITRGGELKGDLILKGSGDPSLTSLDLLSMAKQLKDLGVKKFKGRIIADATLFEDKPLGEGWEWDDEPFYYQAQVSGLNCDENVVSYVVKPGVKVGDAAIVEVGGADQAKVGIAPTQYLIVQNLVTTSESGSPITVSFDRSRAKNTVVLSGTIPLNGKPATEELTVEEPALFTATRLYDCLAASGIEVPKREKQQVVKEKVIPSAISLVTHQSKPLSAILSDFLKPSDNLYGECLFKTLAAQKSGIGTWEGGAKIVRDLFTEWNIDPSGLSIADGSGLSRRNNVTPRLLVSLLTAADSKLPTDAKTAFEAGLPVGGVDGTLRYRFKGTPAQGKIQAKTGSLTGVSALSGYLTTKTGERLVFSILMNHFSSGGPTSQARAAQDAIILSLMDAPKPLK